MRKGFVYYLLFDLFDDMFKQDTLEILHVIRNQRRVGRMGLVFGNRGIRLDLAMHKIGCDDIVFT